MLLNYTQEASTVEDYDLALAHREEAELCLALQVSLRIRNMLPHVGVIAQ